MADTSASRSSAISTSCPSADPDHTGKEDEQQPVSTSWSIPTG
jgi:hypothetical protein